MELIPAYSLISSKNDTLACHVDIYLGNTPNALCRISSYVYIITG